MAKIRIARAIIPNPYPQKNQFMKPCGKILKSEKDKEAGGSRQKLRVATPRDLEFREPFLLLSVTL